MLNVRTTSSVWCALACAYTQTWVEFTNKRSLLLVETWKYVPKHVHAQERADIASLHSLNCGQRLLAVQSISQLDEILKMPE